MKSVADLHSHSIFSDGRWSVKQYRKYLEENPGLILSITDHDSLEIYEEISPEDYPGQLLPGVEVSCMLGDLPVHILVYGELSCLKGILSCYLSRVLNCRRERYLKIVSELKSLGLKLDGFEMPDRESQMTASHLASELVHLGYAKNFDDAFGVYLKPEKCPSILYTNFPQLDELLELTRGTGLIPVLAHPQHRFHKKAALIEKLSEKGLLGIEAFHPSHSSRLRRYYKKLARKLGILATGGSDFHGTRGQKLHIGGLNPMQWTSFKNSGKLLQLDLSSFFQEPTES